MTVSQGFGEPAQSPTSRGRIYGVVVATVTNNGDPKGLGRLKVKFPWLSDTYESGWARMMAPMAGKGRGLYMLPEIDDEVLVMFEQGQVDHPYVLGALWNGVDTPPVANTDGENNVRAITSRSGHTITLDDTSGAEKITISDSSGSETIVLDSAAGSLSIASDKKLTIQARGDISLASSGGDVSISCKSFSVSAEQGYHLSASQGKLEGTSQIAIDCLAGVNINSGALEVR